MSTDDFAVIFIVGVAVAAYVYERGVDKAEQRGREEGRKRPRDTD